MAEEMSMHDLSLEYAIDHIRLYLKNITYSSRFIQSQKRHVRDCEARTDQLLPKT
jgi:hypothetical protein